jgi:hypothetical protein
VACGQRDRPFVSVFVAGEPDDDDRDSIPTTAALRASFDSQQTPTKNQPPLNIPV